MIQAGHLSFLKRSLSFLLAFYILNFSIDSRDAEPDHIAEDLAFNDIESIYELVVENILQLGNVVKEHDEPDSPSGGSLDFKKILFTQLAIHIQFGEYLFSTKTSFLLYDWLGFSSKLIEIDSPPPRA